MNSCFENYITLEGLSPEINTRSGLYVNRLPGITLGMFSALTSEDRESTNEFWDILYDRGVNGFINEVSSRLNIGFNVEKVIDSTTSGTFNKPFELNNSLEDQAGVSIEVGLSKYSVLEIQTIKIYSIGSPSDVEAAFLIVDTETDEILWDTLVVLESGLNTIDVFQEFESEKIKVIYSPISVASYTTENKSNYYYKPLNCNPCAYDSLKVEQLNGGGLIVEFNVKCSIEKFICSRLSQFKIPFWYWLGVELMTEALMSRETNCFTIDREEANKNLGFYEQEFASKIDPVLKNLKVKDDSICFECNGIVTKQYLLP